MALLTAMVISTFKYLAADTGDLPASFDENSEAKIWLALSDNVKCDMPARMLSVQGQEYLFFSSKKLLYSTTI
jgi:hypothetical protein